MSGKRNRGLARKKAWTAAPRVPFLDACLIVRDEEERLPGCIDSLKALGPHLNRINVYDTGSQDNTVQIARTAGCRVKEGFWDDDFGRARNESLAMSTAEWAIIIDADERLFADPETLVRSLRNVGTGNVVDAELYHLDGDGLRKGHSRYIKAVRPRQIRFALPVHEVVEARPGYQVNFVRLTPAEMHFEHLGYATSEIRRQKAGRNLALADNAVTVARANGDVVALVHALQHRARSWTGEGSRERAIADLTELWGVLPQASTDWIVCARELIDLHRRGRDFEAAHNVLTALQRADVPPVQWLAPKAEIDLQRGNLRAAREAADRLLRETSETTDAVVVPGVTTDRRDALGLRYRIALEAQEHAVAVAVCALLIGHGEVERVGDLLTLWTGSVGALAALLTPAYTGPHGPGLGPALRSAGPMGVEVAVVLEKTRHAQEFAQADDQ